MDHTRITTKGRITIPKHIREAADLAAGDVVVVHVENGRVMFRKPPSGKSAYIRGVQEKLTEWKSREDDEAWHDL